MHHKGPAPQVHDGSNLRIGIVHARWNDKIIDPLLAGTKAKLLECGVKESNIVVQTVPGSWELPIAVQRLYAASQFHLGPARLPHHHLFHLPTSSTGPFDALIAIGVLIKGETMHFEYISGSVSDGLMRVSLDTGVPVVLGF
ncbi:lumazine synthase [Collariella sp. IMI 366227]|nr:lumazine synthase [Collariella sp. IMI 366227]